MTASTEIPELDGADERACGRAWRQRAARMQAAALPGAGVVVSCSARRGVGGLGRHVHEILATLERDGRPARDICGLDDARALGAEEVLARALDRMRPGRLVRTLPTPASPGTRARAFMVEFDRYAARALPKGEHLIAFNGQATAQFHVAARTGYRSLALVSANPHIRRLAGQHARAYARYPLERSWAARLLERNLAEYAQAQRIYFASAYVRDSFLEHGFREEDLVCFPLTPDPRYERRTQPPSGPRFEVVYVGSLSVHKGVPLLIDAFRRLGHADMRLTLVGGWGTRGMRRFVQSACAQDTRIEAAPGDPLVHLRRARLYVHPAYEDGFGYAPAEALACGVPLLVSEDTGMKELIDSPASGRVLPTGDLDALTDAIDAAYRGEILGG
jgi:glycosyltransferase involved in cell wall biosynthesis